MQTTHGRIRPLLACIVAITLAALLVACSGPSRNGEQPTAPATAAITPTPPPPASTATEVQDPTATPTPSPPAPTATTTAPTEPPAPEPTAPSAPSTPLTLTTFDTTERVIAITIDAGADQGYATEILDTLAAKQVKATFGMTGAWAEDNPELVQRMVADGHQLINHTYGHPSYTGFSTQSTPLPRDQRISELTRTEALIQELTGYDMRPYFRPPFGDYDDSVLQDIATVGYTVNVLWSVDSLGWMGLTADEILERCLNASGPGGIILMHLGSQSQDAAALPALIDQLRADGYRFVTIEEMVGR